MHLMWTRFFCFLDAHVEPYLGDDNTGRRAARLSRSCMKIKNYEEGFHVDDVVETAFYEDKSDQEISFNIQEKVG